MAIQISDGFMAYELDGDVVATARSSQHAAADGQGAWIVSTYPARLFTYAQAITALALAGRLAAGFDHTDPHVKTALALASTCVDLRVTQVANQTWACMRSWRTGCFH